jgi:hypothetical protein
MTRLQAVNLMLAAVGEQPVNSIGVADSADVSIAELLLDEVNRAVQVRGWHFNTELDVEMQPDIDGVVTLPLNVSHADVKYLNAPSGSNGVAEIVQRDGKLYDRNNHTFDLGQSPIKVDVVYMFDFEELPQAVRQYVAARAAREYQDKVLGDPTLARNLYASETSALAELRREETKSGDYNLVDSWSVRRAIRRDSPLNRMRRSY